MSEIAYDTIKECLTDITEGEALDILAALRDKFGWAASVFVRDDIENEYNEQTNGFPVFTEGITDYVMNSYEWNNTIPDLMTERGAGILTLLVMQAIQAVQPDL